MTIEFMRQGDVGIKKIDKIPERANKVSPKENKIILAFGEVTGHHHRFEVKNNEVEMFDREGKLYIRVNESAKLRHEEHDPLTFEPGDYEIINQREYHPQEIRNIRD